MKKQLALLTLIISSIVFIGCNNSINDIKEEIDLEEITYAGIDSLTPNEWSVATDFNGSDAIFMGYLNEDDYLDCVVVNEKNEAEEFGKSRMLIVATGNENGDYKIDTMAENVVMDSNSGGVWGDPFEEIIIEDKKIIVKHYGGSNWRWYMTDTYQRLDEEWYLIESVEGTYFSGAETMDEAEEITSDYLSGKYFKTTYDENQNEVISEGRIENNTLIKMIDK